MTNAIQLIRNLDTPASRERKQPLKSRRLRRQEMRSQSTKPNSKKNG
ncbi:MAG TPA: hypothetical protein V6D11_33100 [Waterburya sp.]